MFQSALLAEFRQTRACCVISTLGVLVISLCLMLVIATSASMTYAWPLLLLCPLLMLFMWRYSRSVRVLLYKDHLVRRSLLGNRVFRLNAKTEFYYYHLPSRMGSMLLRQPYITLKYGKKMLTLDSSLQHVDILRDALLELEQIYQQPVTEHALLNHRSIFFGELKVSATGLAYKNQVLSYHDVKDCSLQKGHFRVLKQQGKQTALDIPVSKIPNIKTFFAVLDYYMARQA